MLKEKDWPHWCFRFTKNCDLKATHHVIVVVGAPEIRTVSRTEVGFVTFGLVDPFPVEVTPEVDVE